MGNCLNLYRLSRIDADKIPVHSMNGIKTYARVVDVYDGDTITIIMKYNNKYDKFKIRMYGYDAPEMRPLLSSENRQQEKTDANKARQELCDLILNKIIILECLQFDKYGRLLGNVYTLDTNMCVNKYMLDNVTGCYSYTGGTKKIRE